jgi:hypothetical protein
MGDGSRQVGLSEVIRSMVRRWQGNEFRNSLSRTVPLLEIVDCRRPELSRETPLLSMVPNRLPELSRKVVVPLESGGEPSLCGTTLVFNRAAYDLPGHYV